MTAKLQTPFETALVKEIRGVMLNLIRQGCCGMSVDELLRCVNARVTPDKFLATVRAHKDIAAFVLEGGDV